MATYLETSWDNALLDGGGIAIKIQDDGGTVEFAYTTGAWTHTDISGADSDFSTDLATQLAADANADGTLVGTYTITWNGTTGYTISVAGSSLLTLVFTSTSTVAQGTNMRRILGFSTNQVGATSYSSDVRPYYLIIPTISGRTDYTRERESPDIVNEAIADDGSRVFISKTTADKVAEWTHVAEIETTPAVFSSNGTPTHKDMVDAGTVANDVPWSWEHFFEHLRTHHHRVYVLDGSASEVWEIRGDGMFLNATRWSGTDQPLWQVPIRARLIGRL